MKNKINIKDLALCASFSAICCVFSIISFPIGTVPVSLGTLGIMLAPMILGTKRGSISVLIFILLGMLGLPVFSGMRGGIGIIAGPTGGYIYSYILMAVIIGLFSKQIDVSIKSRILAFFGCVLGIIVCYAVGTVHFMLVFADNNGLFASLATCVFPFIPFDLAKALLAVIIAPRLRKLAK